MEVINLQEFLVWNKEGRSFTLVDVRSHDEFKKKHIPSAIPIPLDRIDTNLTLIDISRPVMTICGKGGGRSLQAAEFLRAKGYEAYFLEGGTAAYFK